MDDNTISTAEAAALLGVSRTTVTRLVNSGQLKGYKKTPARNSPMRVYRDSVLEFITEKQGRQLPEAVPAHEEG
jgi:excisionase family DNA binding protein